MILRLMPYFTVHIYYPVLELLHLQIDSVGCNYDILTCYFLKLRTTIFLCKNLIHINISGNLKTIDHLNLQNHIKTGNFLKARRTVFPSNNDEAQRYFITFSLMMKN